MSDESHDQEEVLRNRGFAGHSRYTEQEYAAMLANASVGIAFTRDRRFFLCNPKFASVFEWNANELIGQLGEVIFPSMQSYEALAAVAVPILESGRGIDVEWELKRKSGGTVLCRLIGRPIDIADVPKATIWIAEDITERVQAVDEIKRLNREQSAILQTASVGIAFVRDEKIIRNNPRFEAMFRWPEGQSVGKGIERTFPDQEQYMSSTARVKDAFREGKTVVDERRARRADGTTFWCKATGQLVDLDNPGAGSIWVFDDVTVEHSIRNALETAVTEQTAELHAINERLEHQIREREAAERHAQHLADHDSLTGLPNRRILEQRLATALRSRENDPGGLSVLFVDLDGFKKVNDSFGHGVGDALLKEVSARLLANLWEDDLICRLGGDEFVIVLTDTKRGQVDPHAVARKIVAVISETYRIEDRDLRVTPSVGISLFPTNGKTVEELIRSADAAMYEAKKSGGSCFVAA